MSGRLSNFRDPLGLVLRMIRSRDRAALQSLVREGLRIGLTPIDRLLAARERRTLDAAPDSEAQLILIVGPPRSGTTLLHQMLAERLDVSYFPNWSALFPRSPLTATRLARRWLAPAPTGRNSFYGNTPGMAGPNDAFHLWNRWLGEDRYHAPAELSRETIQEMRRFLSAWTLCFERPLLNKNNRNADCVPLLARALPGASFIRVRRNPVFIAQSLIQARRTVQGDARIGWGLESRDATDTADPLAHVNDVCAQVSRIEARLDRDLAGLDAGRHLTVQYESFCADPGAVIHEVAARWKLTLRDPATVPAALPDTNQRRISDAEFERIEARLRQGR